MRRDGKSARGPRGVLVVPVLKDEVLEQTAHDDAVAAAQSEASSASHEVGSVQQSAAPAAEPRTASAVQSGRSPLRIAGFFALLVALALLGVLVGRALRDTGEDAAPKSTSAKTPTTRVANPPASTRAVRWGPLEATPAGRVADPAVRAAAALAGGRVVVLGGTGGNKVQLGTPGGVLRPVAPLPSARAGAAAFVGDGAVYLIGGEHGGGQPSDEILRFDLGSHRVTSAGRFIEPLAGAGYVQSGDSLFIAGGWTGEKYATAVLRLTSSKGEPALVARLPVALRDPAVALRSGKLYVAGGRTVSGLESAVYVVDLASGTVSVLGRLPRPVAGAVLVPAGARLYLLGGKETTGPTGAVVSIDPATGDIAPAGKMPRPLAGAATVQVGKATLVIGGTRPAITRLEAA
jgi:hypothetical protein